MKDYQSMFGQGGFNDMVDADALLDDIGLDRREIEWRKDYIDFDREDVERLTRYQEQFESNAEKVADMFYENITQYEETTEIIGRSSKNIEALKQTQQAYLRSLAGGQYGPEYFKNRARIGKLHDILEMPMKFYIGQYGVYYNLLIPLITERINTMLSEVLSEWDASMAADGGTDVLEGAEMTRFTEEDPGIDALERELQDTVEDGIQDLHSILKIINLDMQVVADTYIHSYTEEIEDSLDRQQRVASEVQGAVEELRESAEDVAGSADQITQLATEQSQDMNEVAGEVSNLSATVEEVASSAETVAQRSQTAKEQAENGQERGDEVLEIMEAVDESSEGVMADVRSLDDTVGEIDEIIEVINDIADQTNLLALNANIEAARAGKKGEGFAVVANEIKSLAEESQEQAGDIEEMLDEIQASTGETVESLESTRERIRRGYEAVEETIDMLDEITEAVEETVAGIEEVSEASDEQASSAEEIAAMVDQVNENAQTVADEIEGVAAATEEQSAKVEEIETSVHELADESA